MFKKVDDLSDEEYRRWVRRSNIRDIILIVVIEIGWLVLLFCRGYDP